jgi:hypothetical protein
VLHGLTSGGPAPDDVRVHRRPLLFALLAIAVAPASASAIQVGISDQHAAMFSDPLYAPLHLRYARVVVPWNVAVKKTWATSAIGQWLFAAKLAGVEPHVAFSSADYSKYYKDHPPSPAQYLRAFQAFRHRWPAVRVFSPWNEENFYYQPTATRPWLAARFYDIVRNACAGCQVVAADLLDQNNLPTWVAKFKQSVKHRPTLWGLHNYQDVNRRRPLRSSWTWRYAHLVSGRIWITEGGGIVGLKSPANGRTVYPYSPSRSASSMRYLFDLLKRPGLRGRYGRVYVYCFYGAWSAGRQTNRWDSGLLGLDGNPRPAYSVLQHEANPHGAASPAPGQTPAPPGQTPARNGQAPGKSGQAHGKQPHPHVKHQG